MLQLIRSVILLFSDHVEAVNNSTPGSRISHILQGVDSYAVSEVNSGLVIPILQQICLLLAEKLTVLPLFHRILATHRDNAFATDVSLMIRTLRNTALRNHLSHDKT